jgi:kumamolisin
MTRHALTGSRREPLPGSRPIGKANPAERLEATLLLRRRAAEELKGRVRRLGAGEKSAGHMRREDFARQYGADPRDLDAVRKFAQAHGLAVAQEDAARRTVILAGTVAQFNDAFGVDLQQFEHDEGSYRGRTGSIHLPDELNGVVEAVLGLDNRPQARPHFRNGLAPSKGRGRSAAAASTSFTPIQLAQLYDFPSGTGQGECIAIIELGGGYRTKDLQTYFKALKITPPNVIAVSVDHGRNHATGTPTGPDGEVMLDLEVAGAVAPDAKIVVYFAPNTDAGFLDAITTAIHDSVNNPSVVSISWGGPESTWTQQSLTAYDQAFQEAAALGVTVTCAAGDSGSSDGVNDGAGHVDFPASSPHVLACGGTRLTAANGKIASEVVWNNGANGGASGGGVSAVFALPDWQKGLQVATSQGAKTALKMRGVPDVAGDADPQTGYDVRVDGLDTVFGGTSAVAPLWAGLIARINSAKGSPAGFVNPQLYENPAALNDIIQGDNGAFVAAAGWDACTGLGSPDGQKVAAVI